MQNTNVNNLIINKLTQTQFNNITPSPTELYFVTDDTGLVAGTGIAINQSTATISLADSYGDTKNPYSSKTKNYVLAAPHNTNGVPTFRALVSADIPISDWAKANTKPSYALSEITGADDVKAIEALTGTSGFLKKTNTGTWTLDTNTYLTSHQTLPSGTFTGSPGADKTITIFNQANGAVSATFADIAIAGSQVTSGTINFNRLPTMYWANVAISSQSSTTTSPTFFAPTITGETKLISSAASTSAANTTSGFRLYQNDGSTLLAHIGVNDSGGLGFYAKTLFFRPAMGSNGAVDTQYGISMDSGGLYPGSTSMPLGKSDKHWGNGYIDHVYMTDLKKSSYTYSFPNKSGTVALTSDLYTLPISSADTLGGIKIGDGLSVNSTTGVVSVIANPSYGKIQITGVAAGAATLPVISNNALIEASTENETLIIAQGNKWISIAGNSANVDSCTIGHALTTIGAGTVGTSSATSGATLAVPYVTYDEAGHITAVGTHTHTINSLAASAIASGVLDFARLPTVYWANVEASSAATYNKTPEVATIKINGNTSASSASTKNVELIYDATLEVLNFVFS